MSYPNIGGSNQAILTGDNALIEKEFWGNEVEIINHRNARLAPFVENGDNLAKATKPFMHRTQPVEGGQKVHFNFSEPTASDRKHGNATLVGTGAFVSSHGATVVVNRNRHAFATEADAIEFTQLGQYGMPQLHLMRLGEQKAFYCDCLRLKRLLWNANDNIVTRPNGKETTDALRLGDTLNPDSIKDGRFAAHRNGAREIEMGKTDAGAEIHSYTFIADELTLEPFRRHPQVVTTLQEMSWDKDTHPLLNGNTLKYDKQVLYHFSPVDLPETIPGTPLMPYARLAVAVTAANVDQDNSTVSTSSIADLPGVSATTDLGTGLAIGESLKMCAWDRVAPSCLHFNGYVWQFADSDTYGQDGVPRESYFTQDRYYVVINKSGSDKGKWGFYKSTSVGRNYIPMVERLRASASGIAASTVGGVDWNGDYHTDAHPADSIVIETNAYAVPVARVPVLGKACAVEAHGKTFNKLTREQQDHEHLLESGLTYVWGSEIVPRSDHTVANPFPANYGMIECAAYFTPGMLSPQFMGWHEDVLGTT